MSCFKIYPYITQKTQSHFLLTIAVGPTPRVTLNHYHFRTLIFDLILPPTRSGRPKVVFPAWVCTGKPYICFPATTTNLGGVFVIAIVSPATPNRSDVFFIAIAGVSIASALLVVVAFAIGYVFYVSLECVSILLPGGLHQRMFMMKAVFWATCLLQKWGVLKRVQWQQGVSFFPATFQDPAIPHGRAWGAAKITMWNVEAPFSNINDHTRYTSFSINSRLQRKPNPPTEWRQIFQTTSNAFCFQYP